MSKKKSLNLMNMVPQKKRDFEIHEGIVHVLCARFEWGPLKRWLLPRMKNPFIRVKLDTLGSKVWQKIDGNNTVYQISLLVCKEMDEQEDEMWHKRMAIFFQMLKRRDLITFEQVE